MPAINAAVEAISVKEMPEADRFGNTHRANLKIGEDWFAYGAIKKPEINIKTGDSWTQLQKGMEVEFMYDVNGDFKNIKKKTFSITDKSNAQPSAPQQTRKPQQQSGGGKEYVNPQTVGACLNLSVQVLGYTKKDFDDEKKLREAIAWHKGTFDALMKLYSEVEPEDKTFNKKEEPPFDNDVEMEYDDDEI